MSPRREPAISEIAGVAGDLASTRSVVGTACRRRSSDTMLRRSISACNDRVVSSGVIDARAEIVRL